MSDYATPKSTDAAKSDKEEKGQDNIPTAAFAATTDSNDADDDGLNAGGAPLDGGSTATPQLSPPPIRRDVWKRNR